MAGPVLLFAALAAFIAFHLFPVFGWKGGWEVWRHIVETIVMQPGLLKGLLSIAIAIFATFSAGVVFAPFAIPLIRKSGLAERFIAFFSALVSLALWFALLGGGVSQLRSGGIFLLLAAGCNFTGVLLIRYEGAGGEPTGEFSGN